MGSFLSDSLKQLEALRDAHTDSILVGYSGGKDSLVTMDLCCRVFRKVAAFYMYCVPGLPHIERQIEYARSRWGVTVLQFPDFRTVFGLKEGAYCDSVKAFDSIKDFGLREAYGYAMEASGIRHIAVGMKDSDGLRRRQFFANIRDGSQELWTRVHFPIKKWRKKDVVDYLHIQKIPLPASIKGAVTTGVGLDHDSICWLHDTHPEDFRIFSKWFPYAEAEVKRRDWFGV
jgi:phosphoadenosine phosphosulfate reductase